MASRGLGRGDGLWVLISALLVVVVPELQAVTITEIMYHPAAADEAALGGRSLEWVELYNETPTTLPPASIAETEYLYDEPAEKPVIVCVVSVMPSATTLVRVCQRLILPRVPTWRTIQPMP